MDCVKNDINYKMSFVSVQLLKESSASSVWLISVVCKIRDSNFGAVFRIAVSKNKERRHT